MSHDGCRIESSEDPPQSEGETGLESLGRAAVRVTPESHVELYLGRAVE